MAYPAAPTESGGAKLHFGTTNGNAAAGWFAVDTGTTGTGSNTVGFLAIATHVEGDAVGAPGGLATTSVPLVLAGADDGTNAVPLQIDGSGHLQIDIAASSATVIVDLAGNNDVTVSSTDSDGLEVQGGLDHDAVDAGSPVKIGGRAQTSEAQPEEVADDDRVDALFDRSGYLRVRGDFDPGFADINDAGSGDNEIIAAQAAGKRIAVWSVFLVSDGTVDARFEDGAAGTAFTGQIPLEAREGFSVSAGGLVPLFVGGAATNLNLELSAAVRVHGSVSFTVIDD